MTGPGWHLYRSFLAVMRVGSLSGAARTLRIAQPTLGRHVNQLEHTLGSPLFTRSPQGLTPTDLALALLPEAEAMESASHALSRVASGAMASDAGIVRITASEIVGAEILPAILAGLRMTHPRLAFELVLSNRTEDLLRRDADIAVRMVRPVQEALVAKSVGRIKLGLYARRDYLDRNGTPANFEELERHTLIGFDRQTLSARSLGDLPSWAVRENFALRTDSDLAQLAAIRAGYGIGVCQVPIAKRDPALIRVLAGAFEVWLDTWIVMHENLRASRRVRLVFDHLGQELQRLIVSAHGRR